VPKVLKAAEAARQADEQFDHAGPDRLIGTLYAKAPPWPASIGDLDEGIKYLEQAVKAAPDYPQNHLHYADALVADCKIADAEKEYGLVLNATIPPEWAQRAERWRAQAHQGMQKAAQKKDDCKP
jgi:hypothetical protein